MFILPSYYEAIGCVYLEAMACGLPAVGCDENGADPFNGQAQIGHLAFRVAAAIKQIIRSADGKQICGAGSADFSRAVAGAECV